MEKKTCFVVSIIGNEGSEQRKHSDNVFDHIINPALSKDFNVIRADKIFHSDKIDERIFKLLREADLVLADLTGKNPNVFLEVGYRMAINKPIVYIMQKDDERLPFDIQNINIKQYNLKSDDVLTEASKAKNYIEKTVENMVFDSQETTEVDEVNINRVMQIIVNIQSNLDVMNSRLLDGVYTTNQVPSNDNFNERLLIKALEEPEKMERLLNLVNKYPQLLNQNQ